jgi:hypothetical protein
MRLFFPRKLPPISGWTDSPPCCKMMRREIV